MRLVTITWRNLFRRKARTLLTISGLAVAVLSVVALVGISEGFQRSYVDLFSERQVDIIVQHAGSSNNLNRQLDYSVGDKLRKVSGVREVLPGQMDVLSLPELDLEKVFVIGWEPGCRLFKRLPVIAGRGISANDHHRALIGSMLASLTGKKPGDTLDMYGQKIEIVGVVDSHFVYEQKAILMPILELQKLMDSPKVTAFSIWVDHPEQPGAIDEVQHRIETANSNLIASPATDFVSNIREIRTARTVAWAISAIALIIGAVGMLNTMIMSVAERVKEIGTLRAIGWSKRRVMTIILWESVLLSVAGAAVGTAAAIGLISYLSHFRQTSGWIQSEIAPMVMLQGLLVALAVGVVGAAYPAYWGANLLPTEALRRK